MYTPQIASQISQIGIPSITMKNGQNPAQNAADGVSNFGTALLVPTVAGSGVVTTYTKDNQAYPITATTDEITGVQNVLVAMKDKSSFLSISTPDDLWKFCTFISYEGGAGDMAIMDIPQSVLFSQAAVKGLYGKNVMQGANYTLSSFSGECSSYARLYNAALALLGIPYFYTVFFTPLNPDGTLAQAEGHATSLYSADGKTWHCMNYAVEYTWTGSPWNIAYLWAEIYKTTSGGWQNFAVTVAENVWWSEGEAQKEFVKILGSDSISHLLSTDAVNPSIVPQIKNWYSSSDWNSVQNQAISLFSINGKSTSNSSSNTSSLAQFSMPEIVGFAALMSLALLSR